MGRAKYRDYGIRPKGSPEIACDPFVLMQVLAQEAEHIDSAEGATRHARAIEVFNFLVKTAMSILPPKQREIFYSVWVRSGGRMNKGIMEFSRRTGGSHYTAYNNYYKAVASLQNYLVRTGYAVHIVEYLHGHIDSIDKEEP
jgi:hypothetical protein